MAFRVKEAAIATGLIFAAPAQPAQVTVDVRHHHLRGYGAGTLAATDTGLSFRETGKKAKHSWTLAWRDVQQLWLAPGSVRVLTYADTWWKLGADREHELRAAPGASFEALYPALKRHLDRRLVATLADVPGETLWRAPVKLREKFGGPEGVLAVASDRIVFDSPEKGKSRTWRLDDIENVSSSGPFDLTFVTFERSKGDYGDRKGFTFQLKQPIAQQQFNDLWRRLNRSKQIDFITSIQEKQP